jgi:hypothetical protein
VQDQCSIDLGFKLKQNNALSHLLKMASVKDGLNLLGFGVQAFKKNVVLNLNINGYGFLPYLAWIR